jgi:hypothetical protein
MVVREMSSTLTPTATYLIGPRGPEYRRDDTQLQVDGQGHTFNGKASWYVFDGLGSVVGELDPLGNLTSSPKYDVYGAVRSNGEAATTKQGFVGALSHFLDDTGLLSYDDLSYDAHADLLYALAGQYVAHLRTYLPEESVANVLQSQGNQLAKTIHTQMQGHYYEGATAYEVQITKGFVTLRDSTFSAVAGETDGNFRQPTAEKEYIRGLLFGGFAHCLYPRQRFASDPERRFAVILENDGAVHKWFDPDKELFQIYYGGDHRYQPDFVVETTTDKLLCEIKRSDLVDSDPLVQKKAEAEALWCRRATAHEQAHGGKPWSYLVIPHNVLTEDKTLPALLGAYRRHSKWGCDIISAPPDTPTHRHSAPWFGPL